ncbi:MAG: O-methyltransferase [Inconstantimicrobium porci]|uniref:O-methyltransferase n=1 Tax=Inconstantimicrobium porci TaxID=2652291 RepID=UPI002408FCFE|nr:O-methyltransferase [Inconstantimicrobium porci]MDD6770268.1 O-methyltransferase [Inconstantimicrobium porci]MDY5913173.1 O-methyltransferase [Inconstantimicrobium porci]
MGGVTLDFIEKYIRDLIPENDDKLLELRKYAEENNVPIVQKETARFLEVMLGIIRPNSILELGTAIGYSAMLMYNSAGTDPIVTTIERSEEMISIAKGNITKYNLEDRINIKEGDCLDIIKELDGKYDVIFLDAAKGHYNQLLEQCLRLLNDDGVIIADNVLFRGMVASDDLVKRRKITIVKRMRTYLDMVSSDDRLITTVIPMGDGIAVTRRR